MTLAVTHTEKIPIEAFISAQLRGPLLALLDEKGLRARACRRRLALWSPEGQVSLDEAMACLEMIYSECPEPELALQIAHKISLSQLGALGYLFLSCDNLGEVFASTARFYRLVWTGMNLNIQVSPSSLTIIWTADDLAGAPQLLYSIGLAGTVRLIRLLVGENFSPMHIVLPEPRLTETGGWEDFFKCRVEFNGATAALTFAVNDLLLPVCNSGDTLRKSVEYQIETQLARVAHDNDFLKIVQQHIVRSLREGSANLRRIAADMSISEATLNRRLAARGSSFRQLLDDTRYSLAQVYLRDTQLSLTDISWLLAYSEQSAFSRSFRRRARLSPRQFRMTPENHSTNPIRNG